jgi:hypothetical protein
VGTCLKIQRCIMVLLNMLGLLHVLAIRTVPRKECTMTPIASLLYHLLLHAPTCAVTFASAGDCIGEAALSASLTMDRGRQIVAGEEPESLVTGNTPLVVLILSRHAVEEVRQASNNLGGYVCSHVSGAAVRCRALPCAAVGCRALPCAATLAPCFGRIPKAYIQPCVCCARVHVPPSPFPFHSCLIIHPSHTQCEELWRG